MLLRAGLLLALATLCLQIAVCLQPFLPERYQVAPVCETITHALMDHSHSHHVQASPPLASSPQLVSDFIYYPQDHDHHDPHHQCQYCTVYGHLILPPELDLKEILVRIQVKLLVLEQVFRPVYFSLQRLFLLPQGRAPPAVL